MHRTAHAAALRAAMKVSLSVACVAACSPSAVGQASGEDALNGLNDLDRPNPSIPDPSEDSAPPYHADASDCEDAVAADGGVTTNDDGSVSPGTGQLTCDEKLAAEFARPEWKEWMPWTLQPTPEAPPDVVACCDEKLAVGDVWSGSPCCAIGTTPLPPEHALACTPWGPPVPPSMNRRPTTGGRASVDPWSMVA